MNIGIDLDDTICATTEVVQEYLEKYSDLKNLNPLEIINDEILKQQFFNVYLEEIYEKVIPKKDVISVLKRIRNRGNKLYVITSRRNDYASSVNNVLDIIKKWFLKYKIIIDYIIVLSHDETKIDICNKYKIDLMIDDDPYNYKKLTSFGIRCLLFDENKKFELENYVTSWLEIEKYIERNR